MVLCFSKRFTEICLTMRLYYVLVWWTSLPASKGRAREGNGNPLQYSCLENAMDGGAWYAIVHGGHKELDTTEWLHFLSFYSFFWRRKWQPTPVFLPWEFHGRKGLVGCGLWGCKESDTTKQLTHIYTHKGRAVKGIVGYFVQLMYIYWRDGKINAEKEENLTHDHKAN